LNSLKCGVDWNKINNSQNKSFLVYICSKQTPRWFRLNKEWIKHDISRKFTRPRVHAPRSSGPLVLLVAWCPSTQYFAQALPVQVASSFPFLRLCVYVCVMCLGPRPQNGAVWSLETMRARVWLRTGAPEFAIVGGKLVFLSQLLLALRGLHLCNSISLSFSPLSPACAILSLAGFNAITH
jgi:hypothetical protein